MFCSSCFPLTCPSSAVCPASPKAAGGTPTYPWNGREAEAPLSQVGLRDQAGLCYIARIKAEEHRHAGSDRTADCHPLQSGNTWISRLDAVLGTQAWLLPFPEVCHNFYPCPLSFAFAATALLYSSCKQRQFCHQSSLTTASCIRSLFFPLYLTLFSIPS